MVYWDDQKYVVFNVAKRMFQLNQDIIGQQCIRNDHDILPVSDKDKKRAWKSYHEKKLLNVEFA